MYERLNSICLVSLKIWVFKFISSLRISKPYFGTFIFTWTSILLGYCLYSWLWICFASSPCVKLIEKHDFLSQEKFWSYPKDFKTHKWHETFFMKFFRDQKLSFFDDYSKLKITLKIDVFSQGNYVQNVRN